MLNLIDVYISSPDTILIASLDVTENTPEERVSILTNLKILYGDAAVYNEHNCGHDGGKPCTNKRV
jgi:hypothetical protein